MEIPAHARTKEGKSLRKHHPHARPFSFKTTLKITLEMALKEEFRCKHVDGHELVNPMVQTADAHADPIIVVFVPGVEYGFLCVYSFM